MRGGGDDAGANGRCQSEHCGGEDRTEGRGRKVFCSVVFTLVTLWAPGKLPETEK